MLSINSLSLIQEHSISTNICLPCYEISPLSKHLASYTQIKLEEFE